MPLTDCFALLDDCDPDGVDRCSRLYTGYGRTLPCRNADELDAVCAELEAALAAGWHAVGLFRYELGAALHGIAPHPDEGALAEILLFARCQPLTQPEVAAWLAARDDASEDNAGIAQVRASVDADRFDAALARIHGYIEAGDAYQINYTYRLRFEAYGTPRALYRRLRARQPVPYGAFVALPDGRCVLSLSPELFVQHQDGAALARPMKGTAAASGDPRIDAERAAELAADPKNRAENLMIVDLLRNDFGRLAEPGSVRVPALFEVTRYAGVLQMTSTVQAHWREDVTLADALRAVFPCGSVTGAPKRRAMQIIRELEPDPRGLYTGAIGWFEPAPPRRAAGNFCMSVPIRTALLQPPLPDGRRRGELGVGAGIVHDSAAADEYAECRLKAAFLTGLAPDFELFETMHASREEGCRRLPRHLERLRASAGYFGFPCDTDALRESLRRACAELPAQTPHRLRLALCADGRHRIDCAPLAPLTEPVRLLIAERATRADDFFLRHKTSVRTRYDAAWRDAEARGAFDMLFFNADGELTEGARSNIFIRDGRRWLTPPLAAGLLPGVMRAAILEDPAWDASEAWLSLGDLLCADEIVVCNSLRGALRARLNVSATSA